MRAVRRSPLFRIALLSLAVLFAHTVRANTQPIVPVHPPCPGKVAAAQPNSEKKLAVTKRIVRLARRAHSRNLFSGSFDLAAIHGSALFSLRGAGHLTAARRTIYADPQRRPFDLRL